MPETQQLRRDVSTLTVQVAELRGQVATLTKNTEDLVEAWQAATGFLRFLKWGAGLVAAIAAIWAAVVQARGH